MQMMHRYLGMPYSGVSFFYFISLIFFLNSIIVNKKLCYSAQV